MPAIENSELQDAHLRDGRKFVQSDVLIIGGGFGGAYGLWKMRKLGFQTKLLEAGKEFGGTWHWNSYPGARVDSEMPYYSLSIPEVWKTWNWKERFPGHDELKAYFRHVDKILDLSKDAFFNTIATSIKREHGLWVVRTRDHREFRCTYLILATGSSYKKHLPAFPGLDNYKGKVIHAADWPSDGTDVKGKKVGVIGNGATGVQLVQELGKQDCDLTVLIRTPIHALPMRQRKFTIEEQESTKLAYPYLFEGAQNSRAGFPFRNQSKSFWDATLEEREAVMEEGWNRGGFAFNQTTYRDFIWDRAANKEFYNFWAKKVHQRVTDPVKAQIVAPIPQQALVATKRPSLEQDYYDVINRSNVTVVDLKATPIKRFSEAGIVAGDILHELDLLVLATGYDAVTGSLLNMGLKDEKGEPLEDKWKDGVRTYLGLMIPDMPNLFMAYGPQAPTSFANGPPIIEIQIDLIAQMIEKCQAEQLSSIATNDAAAESWAQEVRDIGNKTLYPTADSWYMGANIPGKPREMLLYLGGMDTYAQKCHAAIDSWTGFVTTGKDQKPFRASL
ncbi:hypothetical protein CKM354_000639700 [Cercospora kikuchii]|uniref:FAD/NAD(P)-binding domain-containing protein n=1 Tax=Cercospora kikuchii TaxID=84275 RepID=A0A9P3CHV2_9PEZI|nr:uncharacterized protein CKM354_000639700 [Cercospora kikuchii]GIZ43159.1 hypothetical protein CKM354_000639700 [Cercospora kikuchii]